MTLEFATQVMKCSSTKPRNDANYEKNHIAGRYGAVPGGNNQLYKFSHMMTKEQQTRWKML